MSTFGWAYVDCSGAADGSGAGPLRSVQFYIGSGNTSGSANFLYREASPGKVMVTGSLWVSGAIHADNYYIKNRMELNVTGSTYFGDDDTDVHIRTGSLTIAKTDNTKLLDVSPVSQQTTVRGFAGSYRNVNGATATTVTADHVLGVSKTGNVVITIVSASLHGSGAMLVVKDEVASRGAFHIRLTCSAGNGYSIDGSRYFILTGSMPAISLYSNGANWFVF